MRFEPSGWTGNPDIPNARAFPDYIFRWLGMEFVRATANECSRRNGYGHAENGHAENAHAQSNGAQALPANKWGESSPGREWVTVPVGEAVLSKVPRRCREHWKLQATGERPQPAVRNSRRTLRLCDNCGRH